jgi:hypothetical protein
MSKRIVCDERGCGECGDVIARTYRELAERGDSDAFLFCVDLLELRHPGHERYYYFRCAARLLGAKREAQAAKIR